MSDTPETDSLEETPLFANRPQDPICGEALLFARRLKRERDEARKESAIGSDVALQMTVRLHEVADERDKLRAINAELVEWIKVAAPVLNAACCIVAEESFSRLDEITGCRAVIESCPVNLVEKAKEGA